jgi:hypothetical protein
MASKRGRTSRRSRSSRRPRAGNAARTPDPIPPIIEVLLQAGLVPDGQTAQEHVRIPTMRSPVFGGIGGERRTFGGRERYRKPGTPLRVTVGLRTVNVYVVTDRGPRFLANYQTREVDLNELRELLLRSP